MLDLMKLTRESPDISAIILAAHRANPGLVVTFKSMGLTWDDCHAASAALRASGALVQGVRLSPSGKTMAATFAAEDIGLSGLGIEELKAIARSRR